MAFRDTDLRELYCGTDLGHPSALAQAAKSKSVAASGLNANWPLI